MKTTLAFALLAWMMTLQALAACPPHRIERMTPWGVRCVPYRGPPLQLLRTDRIKPARRWTRID